MKRIKKSKLIPAILLIYLCIMAYMGREKLLAGSYLEYFGILVVTLLCIVVLHFTLRKQEQVRERRQQEERKKAESGNAVEKEDKDNK